MNGNERSTPQDFDPDTAPDLSEDGWPEKFAKVIVRRGRPLVSNGRHESTRRSASGSGNMKPRDSAVSNS